MIFIANKTFGNSRFQNLHCYSNLDFLHNLCRPVQRETARPSLNIISKLRTVPIESIIPNAELFILSTEAYEAEPGSSDFRTLGRHLHFSCSFPFGHKITEMVPSWSGRTESSQEMSNCIMLTRTKSHGHFSFQSQGRWVSGKGKLNSYNRLRQ